ncbi:MAG: 50S ribosomal protein L29 [Caldilineaceae bacterium]|nr:50S ribosomal protein L29 [Caldilineaceae bacterium]
MKASELHPLTDLELNNRLNDSHQELFNLRFQRASGQLTNTARVREVRRTIARIKTLLHQRELTGGAA